MRTTSYAGLVVLGILAGACGSDPPPAPVTPPTPTVANVTPPAPVEAPKMEAAPAPKPTMAEMQMKALKAQGEGFGTPKWADVFTDDAVFTVAGMPELKGKEAIAKHHMGFFDSFSEVKTSPWRVWQKGDVAIVEWVITGNNTKDWVGGKATNKPFGVNGATVAWFNADGLIKEEHVYMDMGTMMSQLGATKQKGRAVATLPATPEMHTSKGTAEEDKNVGVLKTVAIAMFENHKEADFLALMDEAVEYDAYSQPGSSKGKVEAKKYFQTWTKAFPDVKFNMSNAWAFDEYVINEGVTTGVQKGPLGPIKATNKPVNLHGLEVMKISNGKVVRGWSYDNSAELMTQLGLMPVPGSKPEGAKSEGPKVDATKKPATPASTPAPKGATSPAAKPPTKK